MPQQLPIVFVDCFGKNYYGKQNAEHSRGVNFDDESVDSALYIALSCGGLADLLYAEG